jgi:hypothetical protein
MISFSNRSLCFSISFSAFFRSSSTKSCNRRLSISASSCLFCSWAASAAAAAATSSCLLLSSSSNFLLSSSFFAVSISS